MVISWLVCMVFEYMEGVGIVFKLYIEDELALS